MADHDGDQTKKPPECGGAHRTTCPHVKSAGDTFESERYECAVCGAYYTLHYDEMC